MMWLSLILTVLIISFAGVLLFGAPYLPTLRPQVAAALELANLKAGDCMLELGCGDGKVVLAAAKQGVRVVAYELNPWLTIITWIRTRRYRHNVTIIWGDFWQKPWPEAQAIFVFLLPKYMPKLHTKIEQYSYRPVKLVSFAFKIPAQKIAAEQQGVFLYKYR